MRLYVQDESQLYRTINSTASKDETRSSLCPNTCGYSRRGERGEGKEKAATTHPCEGPAVLPVALSPALHSLYRECKFCIDCATRSVTPHTHYFQGMRLLSYAAPSTTKTGQKHTSAKNFCVTNKRWLSVLDTDQTRGERVKKNNNGRSPSIDDTQAVTKANALSPVAP